MLAIHTKNGPFAVRWVRYCQEHDIPFKEVDCFSSDIVSQLRGCRALLWHWQHHDYSAALFARQLIASLEAMGLVVFPATQTCWHYDDKVGQKYLLEAIKAPLIASYVFYDERSALSWLQTAKFPLVWKLRSGAGSQNVRLARDIGEARAIVRKSFRRGWHSSRLHALRERLWGFRRQPQLGTFLGIGRGLVRAIWPHKNYRHRGMERDYVYFQDFIPDNNYDIRVIIIGNRAFSIKRMVRGGDFRASGSGLIVYDKGDMPEDCIRVAFDVTKAINSQCCAFDFVRSGNEWKIVEISYAFSLSGYLDCPGYWDSKLAWTSGRFHPEQFMIEDVLSSVKGRSDRDA